MNNDDDAGDNTEDGDSSNFTTTTTASGDRICVPDLSHILRLKKELDYKHNIKVNEPNSQPRPVDEVWTDVVNLIKNELVPEEEPNTLVDDVQQQASSSIVEIPTNNINPVPVTPIQCPEGTIPCPEEFKEALKKYYDKEVAFNRKLFSTLRLCLEKQGLIIACQKPKEEPIIFKNGVFGHYAIGIKRAHGAVDHCSCLLKKM